MTTAESTKRRPKYYPPNPNHAKTRARQRTIQALYQWQLNPEPADNIIQQFVDAQDLSNVNVDYFRELLTGVLTHRDDLDAQIKDLIKMPLARLDPVEHCVMWLGCYELQYQMDIPYRVVINEALELAKKFGADQGHKFVNGVLDKVVQTLRPLEWKATVTVTD